MAVAFISVDSSKPLGHELLQLAQQARHFADHLDAVKHVMDAMTDGSNVATLEAQFGLPAGRGADVAYLISMLKTGLDGVAQFSLLPDWFGQV